MLFNLVNLLIVVIILLVLNYIKINKKDTFAGTTNNTPFIRKPNDKIPIYGDTQFGSINNYDNVTFSYDNDIIPDNYNQLTKKLNNLGSEAKPIYSDVFIKPNLNHIKSNNFELKNPDLLPSEQDIIYDSYKQFNQPSDAILYNPLVPSQIEYKEKKIQDVYDQIVNDPHKYEKEKHLKKHNKDTIDGGFMNENILTNVMWQYEEDNDGMSYDPSLSNQLSINNLQNIEI